MADIKLVENGNGGDFLLLKNDISLIDGYQNMPYLGMFGGNVEQSTTGPKIPDEQAFDWWGNQLLMANNYAIQMNSILEKTLNQVALNSAGRVQIRQAVQKDLVFMTAFGTLIVSVSITGPDRVQIDIQFQEPLNKQSTDLVYIWDATKNELTFNWDNEII
jgi:hypothetical protein